jgi:hypothetical protein
VEKLCYVLWRPPSRSGDAFRDLLLEEVVPPLLASDVRGLSLLTADAEAESGVRARITRMDDPIAGMLSVWLDCVDDRAAIETALAPHVRRCAGYLVTESVPRRNATHLAPLGSRTPGITMLALLEKPERLAGADWLALWHDQHSPLALEIQCTYRYVRNVVARALTPGAPPWRGLVEEGFPDGAVSDLERWYDAVGEPEKLRDRLSQMVASVQRFLDMDRIESHPLSERVVRPV